MRDELKVNGVKTRSKFFRNEFSYISSFKFLRKFIETHISGCKYRLTRRISIYRFIKYSNVILFVSFLVFFTLASDYLFINPRNVQALIRLIPEFAIVVLGIGLLLITGEIDLSISSTIPFCAYIFTLLLLAKTNISLSLSIVLSLGMLIGLINGLITTKAHIPSFITTLGMLMLLRGILYTYSGMHAIGIGSYLKEEPLLVQTFTGEIFGLPIQFLWFILFTLIFGILLHLHKFGYWIYATGDSKDAARAMGINTDLAKIICFMLVGFLSAFSAIIQVVRIEEFHVVIGNFYELQAIAACAIGGVSLFGGRGGIVGIFVGALIIPIMQSGIIFLGMIPAGTTAFVGIVILAFALLNILLEEKVVSRR